MQGYHISFFSFSQPGFKYETRNDQIVTQVKLFDKNLVLFFKLLCLMFVVILTTGPNIVLYFMWYMIDG